MSRSLVITPGSGGWQVSDAEDRLPASSYATIDEAQRDAREYLEQRGGGRLVVREGDVVVSDISVAPSPRLTA